MKSINNYIFEKFKISSKNISNPKQPGLSLEELEDEISEISNLSHGATKIFIAAFHLDIDILKNTYSYVDKTHDNYQTISEIASDIVNHPSRYKSNLLNYLSKFDNSTSIDFYAYLIDNNNNRYIIFVDQIKHQFYIYLLHEID